MEVRTTPEYDQWFDGLEADAKEQVANYIDLLRQFGSTLRRPYSAMLKGSQGMLELRPTIKRVEIRVFYVFYKGAVLLTGGAKSGTSEKRFYRENIKKAQQILKRFVGE